MRKAMGTEKVQIHQSVLCLMAVVILQCLCASTSEGADGEALVVDLPDKQVTPGHFHTITLPAVDGSEPATFNVTITTDTNEWRIVYLYPPNGTGWSGLNPYMYAYAGTSPGEAYDTGIFSGKLERVRSPILMGGGGGEEPEYTFTVTTEGDSIEPEFYILPPQQTVCVGQSATFTAYKPHLAPEVSNWTLDGASRTNAAATKSFETNAPGTYTVRAETNGLSDTARMTAIRVNVDSEGTEDYLCWNCAGADGSADIVTILEPPEASGNFKLQIKDGETVIRTLVNESRGGGTYTDTWDGKTTAGTAADPKAYTIYAKWEVDGTTCSDTEAPLSIIKVDMKRPENFLSGSGPVPYYFLHTFSDATPAVCYVACIVKTDPDTTDIQSFLTGKITWSIDPVAGSTLSWVAGNVAEYSSISAHKYWEADAQYTRMPENNSSFGRKTASYTVAGLGCSGAGIAKVFFMRDAKNHPGEGSGTTPNWYYYWIEGGVVSGLGDFEYVNEALCGRHDKNTDALYVGNGAPLATGEIKFKHQHWIVDEDVDPPVYVGYPHYKWKGKATARPEFTIPAARGIDNCAATLVHERKHQSNYSIITSPGGGDGDDDGCPDSLEGVPPYYLINGREDTYGVAGAIPGGSSYATYGDDEFLARIAEITPGAVDATKDWSDGDYGKNYKNNTL